MRQWCPPLLSALCSLLSFIVVLFIAAERQRRRMLSNNKWGTCPICYSANVPTDIVIRRIPLLMDFSLFTRAFNISPV